MLDSLLPPRIVVGLDGSDNSLSALRWALRRGAEMGATVEVVHCWMPETLPELFGGRRELSMGSECMLRNEVSAALGEVADAPGVVQVSVHARPSVELVRRSVGAQTLVLGEHGYTQLRDRVVGRVLDRCVKRAQCPVVVVDRDRAITLPSEPGRTVAV